MRFKIEVRALGKFQRELTTAQNPFPEKLWCFHCGVLAMLVGHCPQEASSSHRWCPVAWRGVPSQSPQDQNPCRVTRQCSLPALSRKQFLDVLHELWPSSCDNTSRNNKETLCGQPAPANSLWMARLPLAGTFFSRQLPPSSLLPHPFSSRQSGMLDR